MESLNHVNSHPENSSFSQGINQFSDLTDDEWLEIYSNKHMEDSYVSTTQSEMKDNKRPRVESRKSEIYKRFASQRHIENSEDVADSGMDIGDYDFIDKHLFHCPAVNWVE